MSFCYVLKCTDGSYYTGSSRNIKKRLNSHNIGKVKYTKNRRPLKLVFVKYFEKYSDAFKFEMKVKSWKKRKSIECMLNKPDNIVKKFR